MSLPIYNKQPAEITDIDIDASQWLPSTDTLLGASAVADAGIILGLSVVDAAQKIVKQWISGGTSGMKYKVTVQITTTEGRLKEVDFYVKVKDL